MCEFYSRLGRTKHYVIRHSNIYGPHDKYDLNNSHVFGATISKVLNKDSNIVSIWGDGSEERDLLYVSDLVDSVKKIISTKDKNPFYLFNIGSGKAISVKDLVCKIVAIAGVKDKKIVYEQSEPTVKTSIALDCSKAKLILGWQPNVSLEVGIKKTILWYKKMLINNKLGTN